MANNHNNTESQSLSGVRGRVATPEETARRDGYVKGRNDESNLQRSIRAQDEAVARSRANGEAAGGLLVGLFIAILAAAVGGLVYFLSGDRTAPVPQVERERVIERDTTVIERETPSEPIQLPDVQVDVPEVNVPDVNVELPDNNATTEPAVEAPEPASTPAAESVEGETAE